MKLTLNLIVAVALLMFCVFAETSRAQTIFISSGTNYSTFTGNKFIPGAQSGELAQIEKAQPTLADAYLDRIYLNLAQSNLIDKQIEPRFKEKPNQTEFEKNCNCRINETRFWLYDFNYSLAANLRFLNSSKYQQYHFSSHTDSAEKFNYDRARFK